MEKEFIFYFLSAFVRKLYVFDNVDFFVRFVRFLLIFILRFVRFFNFIWIF